MKLDLDLNGPHGKMWDLRMQYFKLPPEYEMEIASVCRAFVNYINGMAGGASASDDASYKVKFTYTPEDAKPKKLPPEYEELFKGSASAENLLYSQAVEIQSAGIELLTKLLSSAVMEIKSGQRQ